MENVSNVLNSVKATLYERISNPLLSTFTISWIIWNYKFALVIFSSSIDIIEKIDYIKFDLLPFTYNPLFTLSNLCTIVYLFIGPVLTSLLYLYVIYPSLAKKVYEDHKEHIKEYQNIKIKIEGETSMSEEDVLALKSELRTIKSINSKELDIKDENIKMLKHDLENATKDAAKSRSQLSEIQGQQTKLDNMEEQLIELQNMNKLKEEIIERMKIDKESTDKSTKTEKVLSEIKRDLASRKPSKKVTAKKLSDEAAQLLKIISYDTDWQSINVLRVNYDIHRLRFNESINSLINYEYVNVDTSEQVIITPKGEKYLLDHDII